MNEEVMQKTQIFCDEANEKLNYLHECIEKLKSFEKAHKEELKKIDPEFKYSFFYAVYEDYRQMIEGVENEMEYNLEILGYKKHDIKASE